MTTMPPPDLSDLETWMQRIPPTCPKCGSRLKPDWANVYTCESTYITEGPQSGTTREAAWCWKLQRDRLLEKVKGMEKSGDAIAAWMRNPRNLGGDPFMADQWDKAKETKPEALR